LTGYWENLELLGKFDSCQGKWESLETEGNVQELSAENLASENFLLLT